MTFVQNVLVCRKYRDEPRAKSSHVVNIRSWKALSWGLVGLCITKQRRREETANSGMMTNEPLNKLFIFNHTVFCQLSPIFHVQCADDFFQRLKVNVGVSWSGLVLLWSHAVVNKNPAEDE